MNRISKKDLDKKLKEGATARHADSKKLYKSEEQQKPRQEVFQLLDKDALEDLNKINQAASDRIEAALSLAQTQDTKTQDLMKQITGILEKQSRRVPYEFEIIRDDKGNLSKVKATPVEVS